MGLFKEWGDPGNGEGDDSELGGEGGGCLFLWFTEQRRVQNLDKY